MQLDIRLADLIESCRLVEPNKRPSFKIISEVLAEVYNSFIEKSGGNN